MVIAVAAKNWVSGLPTNRVLSLDSELYSVLDANQSWSLTPTDDDGMRFEVRAGDHFWWDVSASGHGAERSEIQDRTKIMNGTPLDVSYSFNVEPGARNTAAWLVLGQLHPGDDFTAPKLVGPPFEVALDGETMEINIVRPDANGNPVVAKLYTDTSDIVRGHFYNMDIKAVFDPAGNGRLVVTRDGVTLVDYTGAIGYANQTGVVWKEGIYRAPGATETIAATYKGLNVSSGNSVSLPDPSEFIAAPVLSVTSAVSQGTGSYVANLTGVAKANTTVSVYEGTVLLGSAQANGNGAFTLSVAVQSATQHLLSAIATDATGRNGLTSSPTVIEIGSAASIVSRIASIATENVGAIVLTDTTVLQLNSQTASLGLFLNIYSNVVSKIQGSYSYLVTSNVTGGAYTKQLSFYTSAGFMTEFQRYAGSQLVMDAKYSGDGSHTVASANTLGGFDTTASASDGFVTSFSRTATNNVTILNQSFRRDGSRSVYNYSSTAGVLTGYTITNADKSSVSVTVGIAGQAYTTQVLCTDAAGKLVQQERLAANGTILFSWFINASGQKETHSYDPVTGKETNCAIVNTDGSYLQKLFGLNGKNYTAQINVFNSAGKLTAQTASNAVGAIGTLPAALATLLSQSGNVPVYTAPVTPVVSGPVKTTNADGTSTVTTYAPNSTTLIASVNTYAASGSLIETDLYSAAGKLVSTDVFANGGDTLKTFDPASGLALTSKQTNADGSSRLTAYAPGSSPLVASVNSYAASGSLTETDLYNAAGKLVSTDVFANGGDTFTTFDPTSGLALTCKQTSADGSSRLTTYAPGSSMLVASVNSYAVSGNLVETDLYNAAGKLVSTDVFANGGDTLTTFDPASGFASSSTQTNADGSSRLTSYAPGSSTLITSVNSYGASATLIETDLYNGAGQLVSTDIFANGGDTLTAFDPASGLALSSTQTNADGSSRLTAFAKGSSTLVSRVSNYGTSGNMVETDLYNSAGKLVSTDVFANGGDILTSFDPISGLPLNSKQINADGSYILTNYMAGSTALSSVKTYFADKSVETDLYNMGGVKTQSIILNANNTRTTINLVVNQPYAQQSVTTDASGKTLNLTRFYGDAAHTVQLAAAWNPDGSTESWNYDTAGRAIVHQMGNADGSGNVYSMTYANTTATSPNTVQLTHSGPGGQRLWVDTTNANGSHSQVALASGVTLTSNTNVADTFTSAASGGEAFVFKPAFGQDILTNFHAGSAMNHDTIDLSSFGFAVGSRQSSLDVLGQSLKQVGRDAVLSITPADALTIKNMLVTSLTSNDFRL